MGIEGTNSQDIAAGLWWLIVYFGWLVFFLRVRVNGIKRNWVKMIWQRVWYCRFNEHEWRKRHHAWNMTQVWCKWCPADYMQVGPEVPGVTVLPADETGEVPL